MTPVRAILKRMVEPLRSRKVRVALVTVIAAFAAEYGLGVNEEILLTILGVGVALILGIAHEDHGTNSRPVTQYEPLRRRNDGPG